MKSPLLLLLIIPSLSFSQIKFCNYEYLLTSKDTAAIYDLEQRILNKQQNIKPLRDLFLELKKTKEFQKILVKKAKNKKLNKKLIPVNEKADSLVNKIKTDSISLNLDVLNLQRIKKNGVNRFSARELYEKKISEEELKKYKQLIVFDYQNIEIRNKDLCFCEYPIIKKALIKYERTYLNGELIKELRFKEQDCSVEEINYQNKKKNGRYSFSVGLNYILRKTDSIFFLPIEFGSFLDGEKDGQWSKSKKKYSHGEYVFEQESNLTYKKGVLNGPAKYYKSSPFKITEHTFVNGKKHGLETARGMDDQIISIKNWNMDKKEGEWKEYYENSQLEKEENYKDGEYHGEQKYWYENGQLEHQDKYSNGEIIEEKYWYENGKTESDQKFRLGKQKGFYKIWNSDGKLRYSETTTLAIENYSDGEPYEYEKKEVEIWFLNGRKAAEFTRGKGDKKEGYLEWFEGKQKGWHYSGPKLFEVNIVRENPDYTVPDIISGSVFWENGKLRTKCRLTTSTDNDGDKYYNTKCRCFSAEGYERPPEYCDESESALMRPIGSIYNFTNFLYNYLPNDYIDVLLDGEN